MVFHAYDAVTGRPSLRISTITWQGGRPHLTLEGDSGEVKRGCLAGLN